MKVVINSSYGGFSLSKKAVALLAQKRGCTAKEISEHDINRADPLLIKVVEELGQDADGGFAELKIVEIPDDVEFQIEEYDGKEWVAEKHRTWA